MDFLLKKIVLQDCHFKWINILRNLKLRLFIRTKSVQRKNDIFLFLLLVLFIFFSLNEKRDSFDNRYIHG